MSSVNSIDATPRIEVVDHASAAIWASKTGAERLAIAAGMFRSARRMMESHLRSEHPSWCAGQIDAEIRRRFGHGTR
jgi:Rv0078B-related antitoxin